MVLRFPITRSVRATPGVESLGDSRIKFGQLIQQIIMSGVKFQQSFQRFHRISCNETYKTPGVY